MYIVKNAYANIFRNAGRNLLVSLILLCILFFSFTAIVFHHTGEVMKENMIQQIGSEVFITMNKMDEASSKAKPLSVDMMHQIQNMKLVKDMQVHVLAGYHTHTFHVLDDQENAEIKGNVLAMSKPWMKQTFEENNYQIIKGNMELKQGEVIVSKQLAKLNHWDIGQPITLENQSKEPLMLKITGIYDDVSIHAYQNNYGMPSGNTGNQMYTNVDTLLTSSIYPTQGNMDITVYLYHTKDLSALKKELQSIKLPSYYSIRINEQKLQESLQPVKQMISISEKLMLGVWSVGGSIFLLICFMSIRERVYEFGVLRAMGMKKKYITFGMIIEYLMMVTITLCIAILGTFICAGPLAKIILSQNDLSITIPVLSIIEIIMISLVLVFVSSVIATFYINRSEPAKLLH